MGRSGVVRRYAMTYKLMIKGSRDMRHICIGHYKTFERADNNAKNAATKPCYKSVKVFCVDGNKKKEELIYKAQ